ncbi:hypothetical protein [Cellulomonas hominis]
MAVRDRLAPAWLLAAVALVALAVRLVPVLASGGLRGPMSYDEGVHLAVAERLLAGDLLYRDVLFVHPPGVLLAQVPFALLGRLVGEPTALAAARCAVALMGALVAVGIARLLLRRGLVAAGAGGLLYALFAPAVATERIVMLEPALALALVVALSAVDALGPGPGSAGPDDPPDPGARRRTRWLLVLGGGALGLALGVKLWAVIDVALLGVLVVVRYRGWAARTWLLAGLAATAAVVVPFAVAEPRAMWSAVVTAQVHRPRDPAAGWTVAVADRVREMDPLSWVNGGWPAWLVVLLAVAVLAGALVVVVRRVLLRSGPHPARWPDPAWWALLGLAHLGALVVAPTYYLHYGAFLAVPGALLVGLAAGEVWRWARRSAVRRRLAVLGAVAAVATLVVALPSPPAGARVDHDLLAAEAGRGCVWTRVVEYLIVADVYADQVEAGCPGQPDLYGLQMSAYSAPAPDVATVALDERVVRELQGSQVAFLSAREPFEDLGPLTRSYLARTFVPGPTTGQIQVWRRHG